MYSDGQSPNTRENPSVEKNSNIFLVDLVYVQVYVYECKDFTMQIKKDQITGFSIDLLYTYGILEQFMFKLEGC